MSNPTFKTYHQAYQWCRQNGLGRQLSLQKSQRDYPELYKAYCQAQERGELWARESLDMTSEKKARNLSIVQNGGRLP